MYLCGSCVWCGCAISDAGDGSEDGELKGVIPEIPPFLVVVHVFSYAQEQEVIRFQFAHQILHEADIRIMFVPFEPAPEIKFGSGRFMFQMFIGGIEEGCGFRESFRVFIQNAQFFPELFSSCFGKCESYIRTLSHLTS